MIYLNCLAKDLANAQAILKASNNQALIGILTKNFASDQEAIKTMQKWAKALNNQISIGLGNGDPKQSQMVINVAKQVNARHINQVFTSVGATKALAYNQQAIINALINPTQIVGKVKISTGAKSSQATNPAIVDVETAALMIKEMGGLAIKLMSIKDLASDEEFSVIAKACAKYDLILEPTGGLKLSNLEKYVSLAKQANLKNVIFHLYSSIIDQTTGETKIADVKKIWAIFNKYY